MLLMNFLYQQHDYLYSHEAAWGYDLKFYQGNKPKPDLQNVAPQAWTPEWPEGQQNFWVQLRIKSDKLPPEKKPGIMVAFTASYDLYFDGVFVGSSGLVGSGYEDEEPGNVHELFLIPDRLILDSAQHIILMKVSNHHKFWAQRDYFGVILGSYQALNQKPLILTTLVALISGILMISGFYLLYVYISSAKDPDFLWFGLLSTLVGILAVISYLKFFYSYPYPFHEIRLYIKLVLTFLIALGLPFFMQYYYKFRFWKMTRPGIMLILLGIYFFFDYDSANDLALKCGVTASLIIAAIQVYREKSWIPALAAGPLLFIFLDNGYGFFTGFLLLSQVVFIGKVKRLSHQQSEFNHLKAENNLLQAEKLKMIQTPGPIKVKQAGRYHLLQSADIHYIKGANVYSEIITVNNQHYLHDQPLNKLISQLPANFQRVHKSYIVNIQKVRQLKVASGGKYHLFLDQDIMVPVGRTYYKKLKQSLI